MITIASWNVNSIKVRLPHVLEWLAIAKPDVLGLQELKAQTPDFPLDVFKAAGYQTYVNGQKTYNGVALLSRFDMSDPIDRFPDFEDPQRRVIAATIEGIRVINVYVPNGQSVGSEKYEYKLDWLAHCKHFVREQLKQYPELLIMGDLNIAPEDRDVHDPIAWEGHVLVSPAERAAFSDLLDLGLKDSFRLFESGAGHFSWWDYRAAAFRRNRGLRIDHILVSDKLAERMKGSFIDSQMRSWERPSDHVVVMAQFH